MNMKSIEVKANAKINLSLAIKFQRKDGYHELELIFQEIDYADRLILSKDTGINFTTDSPELSGEGENLCVQAGKLLMENCKIPGLKIHLEKRLPVGAGLGGGSSDAAAVLKGGLHLYNIAISDNVFAGMASGIGADVSFFLKGGAAYGTGIGEILEQIEICTNYYILLVLPEIKISTPWAYKNLKLVLTREYTDYKFRGFRFQDLKLSEFKSEFYNDFENSVFQHYPQLAEIKKELYERGAIFASLSGSGSTIYGLYPSSSAVKTAFSNFRDRYRCHVTRPAIHV
jgi:4-diphosphocytidyl-2-C-methyl-D-erythritol kinase